MIDKYSFGDSEVFLEDEKVTIYTVTANGTHRLVLSKEAARGLALRIFAYYDPPGYDPPGEDLDARGNDAFGV